jgi:uncharacterized protein with PQ loop repeat
MMQRSHCRILTVANESDCGIHEGRAMDINLPVIAGTISTTIFVLSALPMLLKAFKTKDLRSYSLGNILLANVGNLIHSVYVFHLPAGPIWLLHSFYLLTMALMLLWYLRYQWRPRAHGVS